MGDKLRISRIETKLRELLGDKVDMTDLRLDPMTQKDAYNDHFCSRALAALTIQICSGVDATTAANCITDGFNDLGIDGVYKDEEQKKLVLVQSKWRKSATGGISQEEMYTLSQGASRAVSMDLTGANAKLRAKAGEIESSIKDFSYTVEVVFCHTGDQKCRPYPMRPMKEFLDSFSDQSGETVSFKEFALNDIYDFLSKGQCGPDISIENVEIMNWGVVDAPFKAYYGIVSAATIGQWYAAHGNKLFNKNIRFYKGDTEVNQGMCDVLNADPESFFYYNNGVKLLCKKITRKIAGGTSNKVGMFRLDGVSLVNGAQTSGSIGRIYGQNPNSVERALVLIQMIELGNGGETKATQITRLTNTQNRIEGRDFVALDPQQERIREDLRFDNVEYLYKSDAIVVDPTKQIGLDEAIVAQACASSEYSYVYLAKQRVGALTEDIEKAPYKVLFNGATRSRELVNNVRVMRMVDDYVQRCQKQEDVERKNCLIHGNRVILHWVLNTVKKRKPTYESQIIDNNIETKTLVESLCAECLEKIVGFIHTKYESVPIMMIFKTPSKNKAVIMSIDGGVGASGLVQGQLDFESEANKC